MKRVIQDTEGAVVSLSTGCLAVPLAALTKVFPIHKYSARLLFLTLTAILVGISVTDSYKSKYPMTHTARGPLRPKTP